MAPPPRSDVAWERGSGTLALAVCVLLIAAAVVCNPIPSGGKASDFFRPYDPEVGPRDSELAAAAALFHVIRTVPGQRARDALAFAEERRFGAAAPYAIERLPDPAARSFLRSIAATDFGDSPEGWRAWWSNPPMRLPVRLGYRTFVWAAPGIVLAVALLYKLVAAARGIRVSWLAAIGGPTFISVLPLLLLFSGFRATFWFAGKPFEYWTNKVSVLGLEGARAHDGGRVFLVWLVACLVINAAALSIERRAARE